MKKTFLFVLFAALITFGITAFAAQNPFSIPKDATGVPTYIRGMPTYVDARVLAAGVNESHTVPAGAKYVIFASDCGLYYVKAGGTAAVPAADVTDGTGSALNPGAWLVSGTTSLGIISPQVCVVTMEFYK